MKICGELKSRLALDLRYTSMKNHLHLVAALSHLKQSKEEFQTYFKHGSLEVELYQPDQVDRQQPHDRDEVYIIARGQGAFFLEGEITQVKPGDFLFVPAGAAHHFLDFSPDFSTWVLFYGPIGGEQGEAQNLLDV